MLLLPGDLAAASLALLILRAKYRCWTRLSEFPGVTVLGGLSGGVPVLLPCEVGVLVAGPSWGGEALSVRLAPPAGLSKIAESMVVSLLLLVVRLSLVVVVVENVELRGERGVLFASFGANSSKRSGEDHGPVSVRWTGLLPLKK